MTIPVPSIKDRKTYLGGSDIAGILGLSQWATPVDIFYRKVGYPLDGPKQTLDPMRERMLRRGKLMEPVVVQMVEAEYPIKITKRSTEKEPNRYQDRELPFMAAEIDFEWESTEEMMAAYPSIPFLKGAIYNGEVKTVHPFASGVYGEAGTDEIPVSYACQAMHGLGITGRDACLFPVLVGSDNLIMYHVLRDEKLIKLMRVKADEFWNKYVLTNTVPPPLHMGDVYKILRIRNDIRVQATPELLEKVNALRLANNEKTAATEEAEMAQFEVCRELLGEKAVQEKSALGRHIILNGATTVCSVALQSRDSIQAKELQKAHPQIYLDFLKSTSFYVCRISKK